MKDILNNTPTVSVVMCTYNGAKYVGAQLDSILKQTYHPYEIIVQDDHSLDGTWEILEQYASQNSNIHIFRNVTNKGVNGNFFSAMRRATGDFIAVSDQDDIWHHDKIAKQMDAIGDKLLCSCKTHPFSDDGEYAYYDGREPNYHLQRLIYDCLPGHTFLFRRRLFTDILPQDNELYHVSFYDVPLVLAAAAYESIAFVNEALVDFRRHASAVTYAGNRRSTPSVGNAFHMLSWCILNHRKARPVACRFWHARLAFLRAINADTESYHDTVSILELNLSGGLFPLLKLEHLFLKDYKILFHTVGGGAVKKLRAALFPLLQYYYYH